jgi:outer membrane receptor protein involved in Fe transport|tara:strand:+ start:2000 stop:4765 length:2766 start_codon:yes stop_codon:yes gene_type:complete
MICFSITAVAQDKGVLKGTVVDKGTGETLPNASISIVGSYYQGMTDFSGDFTILDIKPGTYSVKVQFIGYQPTLVNGVKIKGGQTKNLKVAMNEQNEMLNTVTVVGRKNQVDLEQASSAISFSSDEISSLVAKGVEDIIAQQAGVQKTTDGIQIRGARVYETEYLVDGISAQDPLAGTGGGVSVSASSLSSIDLMTGGASAEYGGGSSGVVNTTIKEGGKKLQWSARYSSDNYTPASFNTDRAEVTLSTPIPGTGKKLTLFTSANADISDHYFGATASQLKSSLFPDNSSLWAPRQSNDYTHTTKLTFRSPKVGKISLTNSHSLKVNQNSRTLQIVGFDALLAPGFQYDRSNNLDNATTYTHHSNLTVLQWQQRLSPKSGVSFSSGRLFTNLRADANGRPFRSNTVDQIYDENYIYTGAMDIFNPNDQSGTYYLIPGDGLVNNGGVTPIWHDHYAEEYTLKGKYTYTPNKTHTASGGWEHAFTEYQWVDVFRPWVGAPIVLNDSTTTPSISIGSSNDIWKVDPQKGGLFIQDRIEYQGIKATIGMRLNYWAPGSFADNAIEDASSPVLDQIREDYMASTIGAAGLRWKLRMLPRLNVSFPVTENNVLYFNYGHSMRTPHPRFLYAGLDPEYQDRSFLSNLGNPNLNPEVNISYEIGYKTLLGTRLGWTLNAFNNNRFDYIVARRVITTDATGRPVTKTMYINQDYAKVLGVETQFNARIGESFQTFVNGSYQQARGKSNSARESALQIAQTGEVPLSQEQFLAWDRPWKFNAGITYASDSSKWRGTLSGRYTSGYRYTPQNLVGYNFLGRPQYEVDNTRYLEGRGLYWFTVDAKVSYRLLSLAGGRGVSLSAEVTNLTNRRNSQIINPITGYAYEYGDNVPITWRDPRPEFNGPQESGVDPRNPARYSAPIQCFIGMQMSW